MLLRRRPAFLEGRDVDVTLGAFERLGRGVGETDGFSDSSPRVTASLSAEWMIWWKVLDGLRSQWSAASAPDHEQASVGRFEVLWSGAAELGVTEIGEEVVLDGRHVSRMGGWRDRRFLRWEPLADQIFAEGDQ